MKYAVEYTHIEVCEVGKMHKVIMRLIVASLAFIFILKLVASGPSWRAVGGAFGYAVTFIFFNSPYPFITLPEASFMAFGLVIAMIIRTVFVYRLAKALKSSVAWLWALTQIIPLIWLCFLILNQKVLAILKQKRVRVGLMGGDSDQLEKLRTSQETVAQAQAGVGSGFSEGWSAGWKAGWKQIKGQLTIAPIAPIPPIPPIGQDSYQGGYNNGFVAGMKAAQK